MIVDGAFFYTFDASGRRIFAPYTVLGPYYIDKLEREYYGNPAIRPIVPTPYCRPRKAPITHPTSFYHDDQGRYLYAEIPRSGHRMNPKKTNMVDRYNKTGSRQSMYYHSTHVHTGEAFGSGERDRRKWNNSTA